MISFPHSDPSIPTHFTYRSPQRLRHTSGLVATAFAQDPMCGHLFLFVNRRRDRLKILYWDRVRLWRSGTSNSRKARSSFPLSPTILCRSK